MTILQFASQSAEEWIDRFNPQRRSLTGDTYLFLKRIMDISLVLLSMPLWLPVLAIIAMVICLTSPGEPVIFKQLRTGKGGRRFDMYKFRTMVPNAEELKNQYAHLNELQWPTLKSQTTHGLHRLGSSSARQVWMNSLKSSMSCVGT